MSKLFADYTNSLYSSVTQVYVVIAKISKFHNEFCHLATFLRAHS